MAEKKTKRPREVPTEYLLTFYDAYMRSGSLVATAAALGQTAGSLGNRVKRSKPLQIAVEMADKLREKNSTLRDYVYESLSDEARKIWDRISGGEMSIESLEKIFSVTGGKELRQDLFVHALISSCFDLSAACRMVGINKATLERWKYDPHFLQLLEEIQWHKKNFFERALIGLVEERHPGAVMYVNRTVNADRGYGERLQVQGQGGGGVLEGYSIDELELSVETRRELLTAIRKKKGSAAAEKPVGNGRLELAERNGH